MANGFKSSLFGFKKADVINYIEVSHKSSAEKQAELSAEIDALKAEIANLNDTISALEEDKARIENVQEENIKRYNELEKLSEEIGKLYIKAQSEAKEIVEKSVENKAIIDNELQANVKTIEEIHSSLEDVKKDVFVSVTNFSNELDRLFNAFNEAKARLTESGEEE